jgi:hypothetical protein
MGWDGMGRDGMGLSHPTRSPVFYILPYFLFYLGLAFRYRGYTEDILTTARFVLYFGYFIIDNFIIELFGHMILNYGI